jgi:cytochrome c-type biogenesis protein CcmH/NrfG
MSFGGSAAAMITSLRNNARSKRKTFFGRKNINIKKENTEVLLDKKAVPEQLAEIRKNMLTENRKERNKNLLIALISLTLIVLVIFVLNNYLYDILFPKV